MKNLLLQFVEKNLNPMPNLPDLEYDPVQQLSVFKNSDNSAISSLLTRTETGFKSPIPGDTDHNENHDLIMLMRTSTETRMHTESTDVDRSCGSEYIMFMRTTTDTFFHAEQSDEDSK